MRHEPEPSVWQYRAVAVFAWIVIPFLTAAGVALAVWATLLGGR